MLYKTTSDLSACNKKLSSEPHEWCDKEVVHSWIVLTCSCMSANLTCKVMVNKGCYINHQPHPDDDLGVVLTMK